MLIFRFFSFGFLTFLKLTSRRKILGLRSWNSRRLRRTSRSAIETRSSISNLSKTIMPDQIDSKLTDWWECSSSRCNYYERYVGWPISAQRAWRSSPLRAWWSTKETKGKRLIRQRSTDDVGRQHAQEKEKKENHRNPSEYNVTFPAFIYPDSMAFAEILSKKNITDIQ